MKTDKYADWEDITKDVSPGPIIDEDVPVGEYADWEDMTVNNSPSIAAPEISELSQSELEDLDISDEEVRANLGETLKIDPDAILEVFDFIPKALHNADWVSPMAKTYIPEDFNFVDTIDTGVSYKQAGDFLKNINPLNKGVEEVASWFGIDSPDPSNEELSAFITSWGHGMLDSGRGIKQILDIDIESERYNQGVMNELYGSEELGSIARTGQVGGLFAEPIGVLLPVAKAKTPAKALLYGVGTGTVLGTVAYVDEEQGMTRTEQAATGAILGGAFSYAIARTVGNIDGRKIKRANRIIADFEDEYAQLISEGHDPVSATRYLKENYPGFVDEFKAARELTQIKPHFAKTPEEAKSMLKYKVGGTKSHPTEVTDRIFGILHTRVKNMSPQTARDLRKFEYNIHTRPLKYKATVKAFGKMYKGLSKDSQEKINLALINGDFDIARTEIVRNAGDEGLSLFDKTAAIFEELGSELKARGVIEDQIDNYWHRHIKKPRELLEALGSKKAEAKRVADEFNGKNRDLIEKRGYGMTPHEEAVFLQGLLRNDRQLSMIGYAKERQINQVQPWMLKYYSDPVTSIGDYLQNAIFDIEQARFFGEKAMKKAISSNDFFDPRAAIEHWSKDRKDLVNLSNNEMRELRGLLRARFGAGQQTMPKLLQAFKLFSYAVLLGNPIAAATQLGDVGVAAYKNGVARSVKAMLETVSGQTNIKVKDLGLVDNLVQEFADISFGHKTLDFILKTSGFKSVDRFGKSVLVNSALKKAAKGALNKNSKEYRYLANKYREGWGREWSDLMMDLRKYAQSNDPKDITDNIRFLMWNELSDTQPISLSEVPQKYLESQSGKLVYMLKTFMLKQIDVLRQDVFQQLKAGNKTEAIKNATRYVMLVGGMNLGADTVKDMLLGRELDMEGIEDIPGETVASFFKTFGLSDYVREQAKKDGPIRAIVETILIPPVNVLDDIFIRSWGGQKLLSDGELADPAPEKAGRYLPHVGKWIGEAYKDE